MSTQISLKHHGEDGGAGFLAVPLLAPVTSRYLDWCTLVMLTQAMVGVLGFWLNLRANLITSSRPDIHCSKSGSTTLRPWLFVVSNSRRAGVDRSLGTHPPSLRRRDRPFLGGHDLYVGPSGPTGW
jgi:hypothetical protein